MNFVGTVKRFAGKTAIIGLVLAILGGCKPREDFTFLLRTDENRAIGTAELAPAADIQQATVAPEDGVYKVRIELPWGTTFPDGDVFTYEVRLCSDRYDLPNLTITWRVNGDPYAHSAQISDAHLLDADTGSLMKSSPVNVQRMQSSVVLESKFSLQDLRDRVPFDANCYMKPKDVAWEDVGPIGLLASSFAFRNEAVVEEVEDDLFMSPANIDMQYMVDGITMFDFYATYVSTENERVELPAEKEVRVPDTFRWRPVKFPFGATCPPGRWTPVTELDLDMEASTREGKYNNSEDNLDHRLDIPGGAKKITVLLYCLGPEPTTGANSWFCPTLVVDANGDGVGNPEEICDASTDVVGQCVYARGRNSWHIDANNHLIWISRDYGKGDDPARFTGVWTMYDYDPSNGSLKIITVNKNHNFDPELPEPDPTTEVDDGNGNMRRISRELDSGLNWKFRKYTQNTTADEEWRWSRMSGNGCNPPAEGDMAEANNNN